MSARAELKNPPKILRRQVLYPAELRDHAWVWCDE